MYFNLLVWNLVKYFTFFKLLIDSVLIFLCVCIICINLFFSLFLSFIYKDANSESLEFKTKFFQCSTFCCCSCDDSFSTKSIVCFCMSAFFLIAMCPFRTKKYCHFIHIKCRFLQAIVTILGRPNIRQFRQCLSAL